MVGAVDGPIGAVAGHLQEEGVDVNLASKQGATPLYLAAAWQREERNGETPRDGRKAGRQVISWS